MQLSSTDTLVSTGNVVDTLPASVPAPKEHLGVLDFLRGFAALSVVVYHFTFGPPTVGKTDGGGVLAKFFWPALKPLFSWGHLGVEVFFVISGFVIPYSLWNARYQIRGFFTYMLKRVARICPPAYVVMLLTIGQWFVVDKFIHHNSAHFDSLTLPALLGNAFFLYPIGDTRWIIGVCWTLSVEFQFYVIIGLLFHLLFKKQQLFWFIGLFLVMAVLPLAPHFPQHTFFSYSPLFALGGTVLLYKKQRVSLAAFGLLTALFFGLTIMLMPLASGIFGLVTALIIALVQMRHSIFSFFGKISFSLYLTHVLVGSSIEFVLAKVLPANTALQQCMGIFLLTIFACMAAYAYYIVVEKPTLLLGKRIR